MNLRVILNAATAIASLWLAHITPGPNIIGIVCAILWSGSAFVAWEKS